eukprot:SAG31_NODE_2780_length_5098_cov_2.124000_5_plen_193_part_00
MLTRLVLKFSSCLSAKCLCLVNQDKFRQSKQLVAVHSLPKHGHKYLNGDHALADLCQGQSLLCSALAFVGLQHRCAMKHNYVQFECATLLAILQSKTGRDTWPIGANDRMAKLVTAWVTSTTSSSQNPTSLKHDLDSQPNGAARSTRHTATSKWEGTEAIAQAKRTVTEDVDAASQPAESVERISKSKRPRR